MRNSFCLLLIVIVLSVAGCATTSDLKAVKADLNQKLEEKLAAMDADLAAIKKTSANLESMRKGQANTAADIADLRDNVQQLRGQIEELKKDFAVNTKKDEQAFDNILLKINFIENFLEIGKKDITTNDTPPEKSGKTTGTVATKDQVKKQDKEKTYSAAYQTFKEGNYDKRPKRISKFFSCLSGQRVFR